MSAQEPLPGLPSVTIERDVAMQMRDGVTLYADVYRPGEGGPYPVFMISHPYDKRGALSNFGYAHPSWYARHGYVVVSQDSRGRYSSEGTFYPFLNEANDVCDTIALARQLAGADGRVATYGFSYPGLNQLLAAQHKPDGLVSICPGFTASSPFQEWFYIQGAFALAFGASWATYLALDEANRRKDDGALASLGAALAGIQDWYWALPLESFPPLAAGGAPYYFDWLTHPTHDEYWRRFDVDLASVDVPALHFGGWWDNFLRGTVRSFTTLTAEGRAPQKLVIGPWQHMPWRPIGEAPEEIGGTVVDDWQLRWLDHFLKGEETGVLDSPVTVYVVNQGWRDLDGWPPSSARAVDWYLHSDGRARSSSGDGTLSTELPGDQPPDLYLYDPNLPNLSAGGHSCCVDAITPMGPVDQTTSEGTMFVLVYTSDSLTRDLELIGDVSLTLYAASNATDTDFTARLCVVDPAGRSTNLQEGVVRARYRDSLTDPTPITPGEIYEYRIDLGQVGVRIGAGHRLRVVISSSDFPLWSRNLNTGGPCASEGPSACFAATQTVLHNHAHPSRITLPIVD